MTFIEQGLAARENLTVARNVLERTPCAQCGKIGVVMYDEDSGIGWCSTKCRDAYHEVN